MQWFFYILHCIDTTLTEFVKIEKRKGKEQTYQDHGRWMAVELWNVFLQWKIHASTFPIRFVGLYNISQCFSPMKGVRKNFIQTFSLKDFKFCIIYNTLDISQSWKARKAKADQILASTFSFRLCHSDHRHLRVVISFFRSYSDLCFWS